MSTPLGLWNYWVVIVLMMIGLYIVIARDSLVKKVMGLNIFQVSVIMFYVSMGRVHGGTAPIVPKNAPSDLVYSNPLPHVLMLTAIVVGIATTALALSLVVRIKEDFGTTEEDELPPIDQQEEDEEDEEEQDDGGDENEDEATREAAPSESTA